MWIVYLDLGHSRGTLRVEFVIFCAVCSFPGQFFIQGIINFWNFHFPFSFDQGLVPSYDALFFFGSMCLRNLLLQSYPYNIDQLYSTKLLCPSCRLAGNALPGSYWDTFGPKYPESVRLTSYPHVYDDYLTGDFAICKPYRIFGTLKSSDKTLHWYTWNESRPCWPTHPS